MELSQREAEYAYTPLEVAIALSLYFYNVSPLERAQRLYDHFDGACDELHSLTWTCGMAWVVTDLPYPTAKVYVQHALERYGKEARERVQINRQGYESLLEA